ncbi:MAG: flagellar basal body rod protein FlgB [Gammaproteobacteria bacterium]|nr:MAG: flagellar basal body rod protein FlgB [Gammaproteobacteria bacterium]
MPTELDRALGISAQALSLRTRRAEVLAANLANADTPNYKARDIDFSSALTAAQKQLSSNNDGGLHLTSANHMTLPGDSGGLELLYRTPSQASLDGNSVDSQMEHAAFMENAVRYQASLSFLSGRIRTLLTAIRGE